MATSTADYGYVEAFLKAFPEIRTKINEAIKNGYTVERFQMSLKDTNWWKARTAAAREIDTIKYNDPKEYADRVAQTKIAAEAMLQQLGLSKPDNWDAHVETILRYGYDETQMRYYLGARGGINTGEGVTNTGLVATSLDELRKIANDFGVPTSEATLSEQARAIASGKATPEGYADTYRELAKKQYASIADALDAGRTVRDMAQPYLDMAGQELGSNPQNMDLTDPKWTFMFQGDKALSYTEFRQAIRNDPQYEWINGATARDEAYKMANALTKAFGGMA